MLTGREELRQTWTTDTGQVTATKTHWGRFLTSFDAYWPHCWYQPRRPAASVPWPRHHGHMRTWAGSFPAHMHMQTHTHTKHTFVRKDVGDWKQKAQMYDSSKCGVVIACFIDKSELMNWNESTMVTDGWLPLTVNLLTLWYFQYTRLKMATKYWY